MRNREVAEMLDRAARILSLRGENRYRVRAYKQAARAVAAAPIDIEEMIEKNSLQALNGVGSGLAAKIKEIVKTGNLSLLERVETGNLPELDEDRFILLASALTLVTELTPELLSLPGIDHTQVTGEVRRCRETVTELELVLTSHDLALARKSLQECGRLHHLRWDGNFCRAVHSFGISLALYLVQEEDFCLTLWVTTGSAEHVQQVAEVVKQKTGNELLTQEAYTLPHQFAREQEIYNLAGLPFIAPELRENQGEVEAAVEGRLPLLFEAAQYKGDLHVHTDWSDGTASVEKMVEAAMEMGYEYIAVTDHSRSLKIARGLSLERLSEQKAFIYALQNKFKKIKIFSGIEADILDDGTLDAPDEVLKELDVVVASVHSGFRQSKDKITGRICRAMENPYVRILGHATGRLLGKRDPYQVDMDAVIRTAAATGTALEINSSPDRLDINGHFARLAKEAGVLVAVNTDAHSQIELANVSLGISMARRGWLTAENVVNARGVAEVISLFSEKKV